MMRSKLLVVALAGTFFFICCKSGTDAKSLPAKRYEITDHGAVGDGQTLNTKAIQAAIENCAADGGGTVVVPKGTFLTGSIFLKQGVNLLVEKDGVLKGSVKQDDYPIVNTRWEGVEGDHTAALVNAIDLTGVEISGEGMIDGSGEVWVANYLKENPPKPKGAYTPPLAGSGRPRLICFQNCKQSRIKGLALKNQAFWCLHILYCDDFAAENLNIRADRSIPSSDGIDVDSSRRVTIRKCDIDVNDDCISIKSGKDDDGRRVNRPCEDVVIENTRFGYGHGAVAMGSEVTGGIRNIEVRDCVVENDNWEPIRFKSQPSRGGVVENITYRNIELKNARQAFSFNLDWRPVPPIAPPAKVLTVVRNVRLINVTGTVKSGGVIRGMKDSPITNLVFENCRITSQKGLTLENVKNVDLAGLDLKAAEGESIIWRGQKPETAEQSQSTKRYVITEHEAVGDGKKLNTQAIQTLIDRTSADGGGLVVVPKGTFLTGAIFLKQGVNLLVEKDGVLKGSTDPKDYPIVITRWEGAEMERAAALLTISDVNGVEITGEGTIDGSGDEWIRLFNEANSSNPNVKHPVPPPGRPKLICFQNCRNARINNLSLLNSASWGLHILYSEDVVVKDLKSRAAHNIPNSDGVDVDSSRKVLISKCDIDSNDDCISIKAGRDADGLRINRPSEDIVVEKCRWGYGHGGVAIGSETSGSIRNVIVQDCTASEDNWAPIRFKSTISRGGVVENIIFKNIEMHGVRKAFEFNLLYTAANANNPPSKVPVVIRDVQLINITGDAKSAGNMFGLPISPIRNVKFENCKITADKGLEIANVQDIDFSGLDLTVKKGDAIINKDQKK